jgi:hypothetical protein
MRLPPSMARRQSVTCCMFDMPQITSSSEADTADRSRWKRCKRDSGRRVFGYTTFYEALTTRKVNHACSLLLYPQHAYNLVKERTATKSMLASKNTRPAIMTPEQGMHWIGVLAGELNVRLRDSREINPGLWPKTLVLGYRTGEPWHQSSSSCSRLTR